jgi:hypothetical protein
MVVAVAAVKLPEGALFVILIRHMRNFEYRLALQGHVLRRYNRSARGNIKHPGSHFAGRA